MELPKNEQSYYKLGAYQKAKELVLLVYRQTKKYPREELFSLVSQIRRAALSILANLVEGYSKNSTKEYLRFLDIAIGSANELNIFFELSLDLDYLNLEDYNKLVNLLTEVRKLLYTYQRSLERKINN